MTIPRRFGILLCSLTRLSAIVKMSTFERKINTLLVSSHDLYWDRKIDKQKRSFHFLEGVTPKLQRAKHEEIDLKAMIDG